MLYIKLGKPEQRAAWLMGGVCGMGNDKKDEEKKYRHQNIYPGRNMLCVLSLPKLYKLQNGWPGFGFEQQS